MAGTHCVKQRERFARYNLASDAVAVISNYSKSKVWKISSLNSRTFIQTTD
jgi:hypothetical protein